MTGEGHLLGFVVQAHLGWVSLQLMFACYSYAGVNHSALRQSSPHFGMPMLFPWHQPWTMDSTHSGPPEFSWGQRKAAFSIIGQDADL